MKTFQNNEKENNSPGTEKAPQSAQAKICFFFAHGRGDYCHLLQVLRNLSPSFISINDVSEIRRENFVTKAAILSPVSLP